MRFITRPTGVDRQMIAELTESKTSKTVFIIYSSKAVKLSELHNINVEVCGFIRNALS